MLPVKRASLYALIVIIIIFTLFCLMAFNANARKADNVGSVIIISDWMVAEG